MFSRTIFAQRIKDLRLKYHFTQSDIASRLSLTRTQISDIENDKTTTSIERLCMLADFFDVSIDYLVGRSDNPNSHKK